MLNEQSDSTNFSIHKYLNPITRKYITVEEGVIPDDVEDIIFLDDKFKISNTGIIFDLNGTAKFYIGKNQEIVVEPYCNKDYERINLYLNSLVLGLALILKNFLVLHGSSIVYKNKCIVFVGDCGVGKSTICSAFINRGFKYLSDDISVVTFDKHSKPVVQPGMPEQRLCKDAAEELGFNIDGLYSICLEDEKYVISNISDYVSEPIEIYAIIELAPKKCEDIYLRKISGAEKVNILIRNIYCSSLIQNVGINVEVFKQAVMLAQNNDVYRLERPSDTFNINKQVENIVEMLRLL